MGEIQVGKQEYPAEVPQPLVDDNLDGIAGADELDEASEPSTSYQGPNVPRIPAHAFLDYPLNINEEKGAVVVRPESLDLLTGDAAIPYQLIKLFLTNPDYLNQQGKQFELNGESLTIESTFLSSPSRGEEPALQEVILTSDGGKMYAVQVSQRTRAPLMKQIIAYELMGEGPRETATVEYRQYKDEKRDLKEVVIVNAVPDELIGAGRQELSTNRFIYAEALVQEALPIFPLATDKMDPEYHDLFALFTFWTANKGIFKLKDDALLRKHYDAVNIRIGGEMFRLELDTAAAELTYDVDGDGGGGDTNRKFAFFVNGAQKKYYINFDEDLSDGKRTKLVLTIEELDFKSGEPVREILHKDSSREEGIWYGSALDGSVSDQGTRINPVFLEGKGADFLVDDSAQEPVESLIHPDYLSSYQILYEFIVNPEKYSLELYRGNEEYNEHKGKNLQVEINVNDVTYFLSVDEAVTRDTGNERFLVYKVMKANEDSATKDAKPFLQYFSIQAQFTRDAAGLITGKKIVVTPVDPKTDLFAQNALYGDFNFANDSHTLNFLSVDDVYASHPLIIKDRAAYKVKEYEEKVGDVHFVLSETPATQHIFAGFFVTGLGYKNLYGKESVYGVLDNVMVDGEEVPYIPPETILPWLSRRAGDRGPYLQDYNFKPMAELPDNVASVAAVSPGLVISSEPEPVIRSEIQPKKESRNLKLLSTVFLSFDQMTSTYGREVSYRGVGGNIGVGAGYLLGSESLGFYPQAYLTAGVHALSGPDDLGLMHVPVDVMLSPMARFELGGQQFGVGPMAQLGIDFSNGTAVIGTTEQEIESVQVVDPLRVGGHARWYLPQDSAVWVPAGVDVLGSYAVVGLEGDMTAYPVTHAGAPHRSVDMALGLSWEF
jgi:hypothetical protein